MTIYVIRRIRKFTIVSEELNCTHYKFSTTLNPKDYETPFLKNNTYRLAYRLEFIYLIIKKSVKK